MKKKILENEILKLLTYGKKEISNELLLQYEDIEEVMRTDKDAPVTGPLTDTEICDLVLNNADESRKKCDSESEIIEGKIPIDTLLSSLDTVIKRRATKLHSAARNNDDHAHQRKGFE